MTDAPLQFEGRRQQAAAESSGTAISLAPSSGMLRVGTWNVSRWCLSRLEVVCDSIAVDLLAVQETHLASVDLERAQSAARRSGLCLHHGRPVPTHPGSLHGKSCGVGFLAKAGMAVMPKLPQGAGWRRLHALCRLYAVRLAPRQGLPLGMLFFSLYAPMQGHGLELLRSQFADALMEVVHALDMQVPTLLMGDFNGVLCPGRDCNGESSHCRHVYPILASLLGPGAPWVDVQAVLDPDPSWTFRNLDT